MDLVRACLGLLMWLWVTAAYANVQLADNHEGLSPAQSVRYFLDDSRTMSIRDILTQAPTLSWRENRDPVLSLGYQNSAVWMRLDVENASPRTDWVLAIENPLMRSLDLFVVQDGVVQEVFQTGDRFEFAARPLAHRNFLFPITIAPGQKRNLYLRAEAPYALVFPMQVYTTLNYMQLDNRITWFYGLLCGFVLVMSLYNFFVFTATRDISYFYYAMFSVSLNFFLLSVQGFGYQYLWPENIYLQQKANVLSICTALLFGAMFVGSFLRLRESGPFLHLLMKLLKAIVLVLIVSSFFVSEFYIIQGGIYITMVACCVALFGGIKLWLLGRYEARFFVLAWCVFLAAVFLFSVSSLGYMQYKMETRYAVEAGVAVQLVLLSFALADRINHERALRHALEEQTQHYQRQHLLAKERALEREIYLKEELERRVDERTVELNETMEKLSTMNRRLELISQLDDVTGLHNQNYFFDVLRREWDRAMREQRCLSLLVIELDDFSQISEQHGPVIQDECLKLVAVLLRETFSRPADVVVRYGDKVFGVLLPETELQGTRQLAQGLCMQIAQAPYDFGLCRIRLSLSIGVASGVPMTTKGFKDLLETAESALYVAHSNGGSQVQTAMMSG